MSYTATTNHGSVTAAKAQTFLTPKALNFGSDYEVVAESKNEIQLVSNKSPLGCEDKFRFGISEVANIYPNSGIDRAMQSQLKAGTKVLCGASSILTFTDSATGDVYEKPIYGTITLTVPKDPAITSTIVDDFVQQIMAGLADWAASAATGTPTESGRIWAMLRHRLAPSEVK